MLIYSLERHQKTNAQSLVYKKQRQKNCTMRNKTVNEALKRGVFRAVGFTGL